MREKAGFKIYDQDFPLDYFIFDMKLNRGYNEITESVQTSQQILQTFGRVPIIYYAGNTNYKTFELSNVFLDDECLDEDSLTAKQKLDKFVKMVDKRKGLVVETPLGDSYFCDILIKSITYPSIYNSEDFNFISINILCTEIGSDKVGSF